MQRHRAFLVTITLLFAPVLAGCGEDDDTTLTEQEFVEQANEICVEGDAEIYGALAPVFEGDATPEQMEEALATIVRVSSRQLDDIDALSEPSALSADVAELLQAGRSGTDTAEQQGMSFFESDDDPWMDMTAVARRIGLDACVGE